MKALSIKQPWAYLIASGIKDIENRTWRTNFRGKIYIHASGQIFPFFKGKNLAFTPGQWNDINKKVDVHIKEEKEKFFLTSAIIGEVEIIDCVQDHPSIWAEKTLKKPHIDDFTLLDNGIEHTNETDYYHALHLFNNQKPIWNWVLANPVLYEKPILNVKGKLSFWEFRNLTECRCCTNKETDEEMHICVRCEQEYCVDCQAGFNQFTQIDYNCCQDCANRDDRD